MTSDKAILVDRKVVLVENLLEWGKWFEIAENRRVAHTSLANGVNISTVFLGLDHGYGGKPLWFETMVFGGPLDQEQVRYPDWESAEKGHQEVVEKVRFAIARNQSFANVVKDGISINSKKLSEILTWMCEAKDALDKIASKAEVQMPDWSADIAKECIAKWPYKEYDIELKIK